MTNSRPGGQPPRRIRRSRTLFARARRLFAHERNDVWLGAGGFLRGPRALSRRPVASGAQLAVHAAASLRHARRYRRGRAACELLVARLDLQGGRLPRRRGGVPRGGRTIGGVNTPMLGLRVAVPARSHSGGAGAIAMPRSTGSVTRTTRSSGCGAACRATEPRDRVLRGQTGRLREPRRRSVTSTPTHRQMDAAFGYIERASHAASPT